MEYLNIIKPLPALSPYVRHYWILKTVGDINSVARTIPTGMTNLIFHRGSRLLSVSHDKEHPRAFIGGQEHTFDDLRYAGQVDMISVVFRPAGMRAFFKLPANKFADLKLTAADIEDKGLMMLENSLLSAESDSICISLIENFLLDRLTYPALYNAKRIEKAINLINSGVADIAYLANATCLSTKQFNRVFAESVGSNPKEFARIIRFQRAIKMLASKHYGSFTSIAYSCGYFDQSHMIKDFRLFSGYSPNEYVAICHPHSDYFD